MNMIDIPIQLIDEDIDQPRYQFDEEALQELMRSIEELGLLSPIKVRTTTDGRYKIIYGNRRYKACKMLHKATVPCIVSNVTDELEIYLEQIAENLTREGFSPIEEAEAFHKVLTDSKFSSSTKFLASKLGKPEAYIKNKCELLKFGPAVKKLVISGTEIKKDRLTEDQLLPLKDLPIEHRDPLALIIARDELPVSDVKKIAKLFKSKDITEATKGKLLYKTGQGLLETWSVHEHNKSERAKPSAAKEKSKDPSKDQQDSENAKPASSRAEILPIENKLKQMLHVLAQTTSPNKDALVFVNQETRDQFIKDSELLIAKLEQELQAWSLWKELATAAPTAAVIATTTAPVTVE
jgi:ParB family transcriptional regulator, chromosome partitioning protein